ncbi:hypothetical protein BaRGS_00019402 [Batillaria attramentaria]|uniref:Uncharacterized protein n=1 Tax=Batillaria attramentaria TaxID=370345 RepID=A0ABD0KQF4_9CAEN
MATCESCQALRGVNKKASVTMTSSISGKTGPGFQLVINVLCHADRCKFIGPNAPGDHHHPISTGPTCSLSHPTCNVYRQRWLAPHRPVTSQPSSLKYSFIGEKGVAQSDARL